MKNWLKGGVIGVGVYLFFSLIFFIISYFGGGNIISYTIPSLPFYLIMDLFNIPLVMLWNSIGQIIFITIGAILIYFLFGALIGFIVGNIKNVKQRK